MGSDSTDTCYKTVGWSLLVLGLILSITGGILMISYQSNGNQTIKAEALFALILGAVIFVFGIVHIWAHADRFHGKNKVSESQEPFHNLPDGSQDTDYGSCP